MLPGKICSVFACLLPAWLCAPPVAASTYGSTLILQIPVKASVSIPSESAWTGLVNTYKQSAGVLGVSYARESSDENTIDLFIDLDDSSAAQKVTQIISSSTVSSFLSRLQDGSITQYNVAFDQAQPLKTLNGVANTELAVFYLLPGATSQQKTDFESAFGTLKSAVESASGELYATSGWHRGTVTNPSLGIDVATYLALVGWESLAAHEAFSTTEAFGVAITGLVPFLSGNFDSDAKLTKLL
ncbi:uncharacterized protein KD926_004084 [Aspergillus affinis]|uniref:uncharacterized protein n=1 Tax=Aspergillus affinis TaxID=1070780 RepID=UPI0022FEED4F|nr:uncharacterized protein KD926_004084 [Aspergillus affinis]KAI9046246.1 hypothetical protein KD926_004084 [Aspergillus affinis]